MVKCQTRFLLKCIVFYAMRHMDRKDISFCVINMIYNGKPKKAYEHMTYKHMNTSKLICFHSDVKEGHSEQIQQEHSKCV